MHSQRNTTISSTKLGGLSKFALVLFMLVCFLGSWSYLNTELLTESVGLEGGKICQTEEFKYFKVLDFDAIVGKAEILCVSKIATKSQKLKLNRVELEYGQNQKWEIIYTEHVYQTGSFFWPVYL